MIDTRQLYKCDTHSINRSQARTGHDGGGGGGGGGSRGDDDDADDDDVDIDAGWWWSLWVVGGRMIAHTLVDNRWLGRYD